MHTPRRFDDEHKKNMLINMNVKVKDISIFHHIGVYKYE